MTPYYEKLLDGGWIIWGTDDVTEAIRVLMDTDSEFWDYEHPGEDLEYDVEPIFEVGVRGLLRRNVCAPGGDYGWTLARARFSGHGARPGVQLEFVGWDPVDE